MALDELVIVQDGKLISDAPQGYEPLLNYGSGRPCVLGGPGTASMSTRCRTRFGEILIVAECSATHYSFEKASQRMESLSTLEALLPTLIGRLLIVVARRDTCLVYPTILPSIQVYWTDPTRAVVASRLDLLADMCRVSTDLCVLSARLSTLGLPWPMSGSTIWQGVSRLTVGECLEVAPGRRTVRRWWSHPTGVLDRESIVEQLGSALVETTVNLCAGQTRIGVDFSGGLDSTAVAFLAKQTGASIDAHHVEPADGHNDDSAWARRAIAETSARPMISSDRARTSFFVTMDNEARRADLTGPALWSAGHHHLRHVAQVDAERGVRLHFTGFGGDELFTPMPAQLWSLWRQRGVSALPRIVRSARMNRAPLSSVLRGATSRRPLAVELARQPLEGGEPSEMDMTWGSRLALPHWTTPSAKELVRELAAQSARRGPQPLSADRARHQALSSLFYVRDLLNDISSRFGEDGHQWLSPYVEPCVFTAALQQDSRSRLDDGHRKQLLRDALVDVMPGNYFERGAKGEYSNELHAAIRHHRSMLIEYFGDSLLADLGLIDRARLRAAINSGVASTDDLHFLQSTFEAERWARAAHRP